MKHFYYILLFSIISIFTNAQSDTSNEEDNSFELIDNFDYFTNTSATAIRNNIDFINSQIFGSLYESIDKNNLFKYNGILRFGRDNSTSTGRLDANININKSSYTSNTLFIIIRARKTANTTQESNISITLLGDNDRLLSTESTIINTNNWEEYVLEFKNITIDVKKIRITQSGRGYELDSFKITDINPNQIIYNGTNWTLEPNATLDALFVGNFTWTEPELNIKSLTVNSNSVVTIAKNSIIHVENYVDVKPGGILIFEPGAYLIQNNETAVNTGAIEFKRESTMFRFDLNTWSSPVLNQNIHSFSPRTLKGRHYIYNTIKDSWDANVINSTSIFMPGLGYGIYAPHNFPVYSSNNSTNIPEIFTGSFIGTPYNGNLDIEIDPSTSKYNFFLLGNPYPSPISLTQFLNEVEDIDNIQIYKHNTPVDIVTNNYSSNDNRYFILTRAGNNQNSNDNTLADLGQAFFIKLNNSIKDNSYYITLYNDYRKYGTSNSIKYKNASAKKEIKDKFWLSLNDSNDAEQSSTLIAFSEYTTDNLDNGYDGVSINGKNANGLFSLIGKDNYSIQSLSSFSTDKEIPLSFRVSKTDNYSIKLTETKGSLKGQNIYLKDNLENKLIDLNKTDKYTFIAEKGYNTNRFTILFKDPNEIISNEIEIKDISVYTDNNQLNIKAINNIKIVKIYNINGALVGTYNNVNDLKITLKSGIYFINTESEKGNYTKKIIIK